MLGPLYEGVCFMVPILTRRAHRLTLAFVVTFSFATFAQTRQAAVAPVPHDLPSTLGELSRVAPATIQDLDLAQQSHGSKLHRVTFWRGDKAPNPEVVEALRKNLQLAVPTLIRDTQASGGSISAAFKLFNDLTAVCHSLDSLLPPGSQDKSDFAALHNDLADLNRLKDDLSSYIEQTAVSYERRNPQLYTSAAPTGRVPKRIIDDTVSDNSSAKKRRASK